MFCTVADSRLDPFTGKKFGLRSRTCIHIPDILILIASNDYFHSDTCMLTEINTFLKKVEMFGILNTVCLMLFSSFSLYFPLRMKQ